MPFSDPLLWTVGAWLCLAAMVFAAPLGSDVVFAAMAVCIFMGLGTGVVQRRKHPDTSRVWQFMLAAVLLIFIGLLLWPVVL